MRMDGRMFAARSGLQSPEVPPRYTSANASLVGVLKVALMLANKRRGGVSRIIDTQGARLQAWHVRVDTSDSSAAVVAFTISCACCDARGGGDNGFPDDT
jgi:hypothetical protein